MSNKDHQKPVDLGLRSRDLKRLLNKILPQTTNKHSVYSFKLGQNTYEVIVLGKPSIKYNYRMRRDILSGLSYRVREAVIKHYDREFARIVWTGSYYRVKIYFSPITIKILRDK